MRVCPECETELTPVRGRRRSTKSLWCWKCERYWKAGIEREDPEGPVCHACRDGGSRHADFCENV